MSIPTTNPEAESKKSKKEWCQNLAGNEASKFRILDACNQLGITFWRNVEKRYDTANQKDLESWRGIYFILFGERAPDKAGYTW